ncbi:hypothetical protein [Thermithiobacillus plumbiphilus]|uniref:Uncharacterized protein n=1 Tax=Thermithiobacillus plumbiphilus TaxID=1729899 RepID=A0ABU9D978_9PROT
MKTDKYSLLTDLGRGRVSKNRHYLLLTREPGLGAYRSFHRLLGLSQRLCASQQHTQRIERTESDEICIEIGGLPGRGSEFALLSPAEARILANFAIPDWARARIVEVLGGK